MHIQNEVIATGPTPAAIILFDTLKNIKAWVGWWLARMCCTRTLGKPGTTTL
ncbi:MAG: hypothetical protein M3O71_00020 [Bacteroidota bacterium]|nr:hypothetical protein [Bacteroidota bacterium]